MLVLILTLLYAAATVKLVAAHRIYRAGGYPAVCCYLIVSAIRTVLACNFSFATRQALYSLGAPIDLALECLVIIEVFRAVTVQHFPVRQIGTRFLAVFAGIGASVSFLVRYLWPAPSIAWLRTSLRFEDYTAIAMLAVLALTWGFLRLTRAIPESPMAARGVAILTFHAACNLAILGMLFYGMRTWWNVSVAPAANGLIAGLLWATLFAGACREAEVEEPMTRHEIAEIERLEDEFCADMPRGRLPASAE